MPSRGALDGLKVLVVEDEALVALNLEDMLQELGCEVLGPAMRLQRAKQMMDDGLRPDAAILDVNVGGEMVHPVAHRLISDGVPVVFATGYGRAGLIDEFKQCPVLQKPYTAEEVEIGLTRALASRHSPDPA